MILDAAERDCYTCKHWCKRACPHLGDGGHTNLGFVKGRYGVPFCPQFTRWK
jgi:hypothetical protein